jgi:hypothetical protein
LGDSIVVMILMQRAAEVGIVDESRASGIPRADREGRPIHGVRPKSWSLMGAGWNWIFGAGLSIARCRSCGCGAVVRGDALGPGGKSSRHRWWFFSKGIPVRKVLMRRRPNCR